MSEVPFPCEHCLRHATVNRGACLGYYCPHGGSAIYFSGSGRWCLVDADSPEALRELVDRALARYRAGLD
jgi:hypothetical protein